MSNQELIALRKIQENSEPWEFAGWGTAARMENLGEEHVDVEALGVDVEHSDLLGELSATAICGNDITSSVLYVIGDNHWRCRNLCSYRFIAG